MAQAVKVTIWSWRKDETGHYGNSRERSARLPDGSPDRAIRTTQLELFEKLVRQLEDEIGWPIERGRVPRFFEPPINGSTS